MAEVRTYSQLIKYLNKIAQEVMQDEVAVKAVELGQKNVVEEVYSVYIPDSSNPNSYDRTYEMMNFDIKPTKDGIEFSHNRTDGDRYVSAIVEYGHENSEGYEHPSYHEDGTPKEYMNPRPFFSETVSDLKNGEFKASLKAGLQAKGLKVEG